MAKIKMHVTTSKGSKITWHKAPTMYVKGTLTFERKAKNDKKIYVTGKLTNSIYSGSYYGYKITAAIIVGSSVSDGSSKKEITICSASENGSGSNSFDFNFEYTGNKNAYCVMYCNGNGTHKCNSTAGNYWRVQVGQIDLGDLPYKDKVDPTNFTSGKVFNQSGVQNGNEKPDRCIKVTWSGEKPGSYKFDKYSIDLFKVSGHYDDNTYMIGSFNNVSKNVLYDLDDISYNGNYRDLNNRHVRPGDTLFVCIRAHTTKGSWLDRYYVGTIKLYKDGKILFKGYDPTSRTKVNVDTTKIYYRRSKNSISSGRYVYYKNGSTIKVIDMYTYCYE